MMDRYRARVLPPDEWQRLGLHPDALPADPSCALILVVENEAGAIIGRWFAYNTVVLEGLAIAPDYQKHPGVAARLLQTMTAELIDRGVPQAITLIQTEDVARLAERHGLTPLDGQLWVLDLRAMVQPQPVAMSCYPTDGDD